MALRQIDDRRLVEPFAGVGTSVEQLLDDPAEEIGAVGERLLARHQLPHSAAGPLPEGDPHAYAARRRCR
jgi:hypothetical protein